MLSKLSELLVFLYAQRVKGFDPPGDEPWMDPIGAGRFKRELALATGYVEYGSGATTVLADRAGIPAVSIESDHFYARAVAKKLTGSVDQVVLNMGITGPWGTPLRSTVSKARRYVEAPYNRGFFPDFILVDGRYRVACALHAASEASARNRSAILMVDDYADRPWYHVIEEHIDPPELVGRAAIFRLGRRSVEPDVVIAAMIDKR